MNPIKTLRFGTLFLMLWLGAAGLTACGESSDTFSAGTIRVCFEQPEDGSDHPDFQDFQDVVDGTIVFDKAVGDTDDAVFAATCRERISRVLQVDVDGQRWNVGYGASDPDGQDITPDVSFAPGQPVTLALLRSISWGAYYTFSARTDDATFLAMTDGRSQLLAPEYMEGLTVEVGEQRGGSDQVECGKRVGHELIFQATTRTTLVGGERGSIELESGPARVMNVGAWDYEDIQCTDTWGPNAWMAWRASAR